MAPASLGSCLFLMPAVLEVAFQQNLSYWYVQKGVRRKVYKEYYKGQESLYKVGILISSVMREKSLRDTSKS